MVLHPIYFYLNSKFIFEDIDIRVRMALVIFLENVLAFLIFKMLKRFKILFEIIVLLLDKIIKFNYYQQI